MNAELHSFQEAIGYNFREPELLLRALTHRSHFHEHNAASDVPGGHNERLEFLGDAVLGLIASEYLLECFPAESEGFLSKRKAYLVSAAHLSEAARGLGLGEHLRLSKGEEMSGGRGKRALLANTLEALIAAIHQDGGMEAARRFVVDRILKPLNSEQAEEPPTAHNFKGALQELAQSLKLPAPKYVLVGEQGPEHSKHFVVEARINPELAARAEGPSKKSAGQNAAQSLLQRLSQNRPQVRM